MAVCMRAGDEVAKYYPTPHLRNSFNAAAKEYCNACASDPLIASVTVKGSLEGVSASAGMRPSIIPLYEKSFPI
ncbi:hypothetical protein VP1G_10851 [Cytospora mali]|uniref:Uncharacterized protein n=1 Tax=Cytospora mali TaxID=578113 RepID=A0A194UZ11_CYTMA|nr:hypothetical protein VP1G_10851 [Valsa mali var. pyri (nom. inval.)]